MAQPTYYDTTRTATGKDLNYYDSYSAANGKEAPSLFVSAHLNSQNLIGGHNISQFLSGYGIQAGNDPIGALRSLDSNPDLANRVLSDIGLGTADQQNAFKSMTTTPASVKAGAPHFAGTAADAMPGQTSSPSPAPTAVPSNVNTYGLNPSAPHWYWLQPGESVTNYNARIAAANPNLPAPGTTSSTGMTNTTTVQPIPGTIQPPSQSGAPSLPPAQAPSVADQFNTSLASSLQVQQQQLEQALQTQQQSYQSKSDALTQQQHDLQQLEDAGMSSMNSTIQQETQQKQAALEQEQKQFQQNYDARQALTGQLQSLLTTGQQVIEQMKGTTGLSSIMSPRISQTMTDVQGQAGVISATLAAYSDQIGLAQNQLKTSLDGITSIYKDQTDYWQSVVNFYDNQKKDVEGQIASLSKDQKSYIDAQIQLIQDKVTQTQQTANIIQKAMLDPTTALAYAKAGVSLTDSVAQMGQKLATYEQAQDAQWSAPVRLGNDYIQTNKLTGQTRTVATGAGAGAAPSASKGIVGGIGNIPTGTSALSNTAIQNGAANAGMNIDTFKGLPIDVQSYYNQLSSTNAAAINTLIQQANSGQTDAKEVISQIDSSNAPPAAKTYLKSLIKPASKSGSGFLDSVSHFFSGAWNALTGS